MTPEELKERPTSEELKDRPIGELLQQASRQTATLVRQEMQLAQLELSQKGKRAGLGAGMFGGAGVVALYGLGALVAAVILLLGTAIEPWLAALIVAVGLLVVAGSLALVGKRQVEEATPLAPEQTTMSVKRDVDELKARARSG
jgi:Putative Actinobacterial Holin-X, holin superfamily III